jgi:hypothetical protein
MAFKKRAAHLRIWSASTKRVVDNQRRIRDKLKARYRISNGVKPGRDEPCATRKEALQMRMSIPPHVYRTTSEFLVEYRWHGF